MGKTSVGKMGVEPLGTGTESGVAGGKHFGAPQS